MDNEKRIKLGVDIGELSNQLVQINNTIEQNYQRALQGQSEYNRILEKSIELLQRQVDLVGQLGQQNQMASPIGGSVQSEPIGGGEDDNSSKLNDLIKGILEDVDKIWEKFSSLVSPIPVEVKNVPLEVQGNNGINSTGGTSGNNGGTNGVNNNGGSGGSNGGGSGANALGRGANIAASGASDPNYIIAGLAGMIPVVGAGVASVLSKMIGEAEQRVKSSAVFRGATGGNMPFMSLHGIGLKNAEAYLKEAGYYPENINLSLSDLQFEKGYNVGGGTMGALLRAMREDIYQEQFGLSSSELGVTYLSRLRAEGNIDAKKVRGYTEDYLKILIDLNQKQLETTGETNSLINSEVVTGIAKTSEKFGDPTVLSRVVEGIRGGLTQAPSPQAEALQYWALSQVNPNASIWEMQLMRENPFSEKSRGYLANYLNSLLQTGNANDVRFNIMNAFGLTATQTEEFLYGRDKEGNPTGILAARQAAIEKGEAFNLTDYLEGYDFENFSGRTDAGAKIRKEAGRATASNEVLLAKAADRLADVGEPILQLTNTAIEKAGEAVDMAKNFFEKGLEGTLDEMWEKMKKDLKEMFIGGENKAPTIVKTAPATTAVPYMVGKMLVNKLKPNGN